VETDASQPSSAAARNRKVSFEDIKPTFRFAKEQYFFQKGLVNEASEEMDMNGGGRHEPTTTTIQQKFVLQFVDYLPDDGLLRKTSIFARGFGMQGGSDALSMFQYEKLKLAVCGDMTTATSICWMQTPYEMIGPIRTFRTVR
jgi:hypothetical protein